MWSLSSPFYEFTRSYRENAVAHGIVNCRLLNKHDTFALRNPKYTLGQFIQRLANEPESEAAAVAVWCVRVEGERLPPFLQDMFMSPVNIKYVQRLEKVAAEMGSETPPAISRAIQAHKDKNNASIARNEPKGAGV